MRSRRKRKREHKHDVPFRSQLTAVEKFCELRSDERVDEFNARTLD